MTGTIGAILAVVPGIRRLNSVQLKKADELDMKIMTGNLLDIQQGIVVHQVNTGGIMGAGVARQLADRYPDVERSYVRYCNENDYDDLLGSVQLVTVNDNLLVANCFSQLPFEQAKTTSNDINVKLTDEQLLLDNLYRLDSLGKLGHLQVYVPYKIGCGIAGGDWNHIRNGLEDSDIIVVQRPQDK